MRIDPVDVIYIITLPCALGLTIILIRAFEHNVYRTPQQRYRALVVGNLVLAVVLTATHFLLHTSVVELWHAAGIWWGMGGPDSWAVALLMWGALVSPLFSIASIYRIQRAKRMEAFAEWLYSDR